MEVLKMEEKHRIFLKEKNNTKKSILDMSSSEARSFLIKGKSYCRCDLPKYFVFDQLIADISKVLEGKNLSDFCTQIPKLNKNGEVQVDNHGIEKQCSDSPKNYDDVNYKMLNNKDGKYAWRPFQLIHPALYVSLVHKITEEENWVTIEERFSKFNDNLRIQCMSLPVRSDTRDSDQAAIVSQWWHEVEQKSIELSIGYQYLLQTDITGCYESFYTHSIAWALHGKNEAKKKRDDKNLIGNVIDKHLQDMSFGQTNGIPQGSILMDFIAEIVLGYADLQLSEKIGSLVKDFQIIRYRDDYRIFVNNSQDGELILKAISEVLIDLGMKLNPQKTFFSNDVVQDSLKEDKRYWINHDRFIKNLQKYLIAIHSLSQKYPNSGSLVTTLNDFLKRINKIKKVQENLNVLVSIITDIALKNPRTYSVASAILSNLISSLREDSEKLSIIKKIRKRFEKIPNTGHLELWLQRITWKLDNEIKYNENLCNIVSGKDITIWNSDWLKDSLKEIMKPEKIIDSEMLDKTTPVIEVAEIELFKGYM